MRTLRYLTAIATTRRLCMALWGAFFIGAVGPAGAAEARAPGHLVLGDLASHWNLPQYESFPSGDSTKLIAISHPHALPGLAGALDGIRRYHPRPAGPIPDLSHPAIDRQIRYFTGAGRKGFAIWLARWERVGPTIQKILREEGVPEDLAYVAFIESGLSPHAVSRAGAAGVWQFMPPTARAYGLEVDFWIDERRDITASTRAAARHLKDLHARFGDWPLALAAYNAGQGSVARAIRYSGSRNFWTLARRRYLRAETRAYVPRFYAARRIASTPERYGFSGHAVPEDAVMTHTGYAVRIPALTDLALIAAQAGAPPKDLADMNPTLVRGVTPPGKNFWRVNVPVRNEEDRNSLIREIHALPAGRRHHFVRHTVAPGETLRYLSITTGVWDVRAFAEVNPEVDFASLTAGDEIILPVTEDALIARVYAGRIAPKVYIDKAVAQSGSEVGVRRHVMLTHRVRRGDTLWDIARRYRVSLGKLRAWNNLSHRALLRPGDEVIIFTTRPADQHASAL